MRRGLSAVALAALLGWAVAVPAQAQSALPQPRVAYAMHSARINQIRPTPDGQRLVSVGQDKTVRVWRMADLQLLRTIHVPSEPGEEGSLRSLVITPDGREVIVGGWTGVSWGGKGQLYRFELATGRLVHTTRGLPSIVEALALSADGQRLAVGLGAGAGLRVVELATGRELVADPAYGERVSFADYSPDGSLATTSVDGCLRLYEPGGQLVFRAEYPPRPDADGRACKGSELGGVRFSPDGSRLAFGLQDRVELVIMDARTRQLQQVLKVDEPLQRSLCCPNWAPGGQHLYMHGIHAGLGPTPLYRVLLNQTPVDGMRGGGAVERMDIGRQRFTNVLPLAGGDLVFSTTTPSLARVSATGTRVAEALPPNGDFRFAWRGFGVSADGLRVSLPLQAEGGPVRHFDLDASPDEIYRLARPADAALVRPPLRPDSPGLVAVLDEYGYKQPVRLGGQAVLLKPFQSVRSWAQAPDGKRLALGTQWSVLMLDAQGQPLWERDLPAPAYQVNISANGRWVVVAVGDGTLRWYDLEGHERLGLFLHVEGQDWVAWRSDGYYMSSPGGDAYIGWLVNRGDTQAPDFHRAVQFERRLYRPELVRAALSEQPASRDAGNSLASTLRALAPPRVTIESLRAVDAGRELELRYSVQATGRPLRELGVYVGGLPVLRTTERAVAATETGAVTRTLRFASASANPLVRVEAETDESIGIDETLASEDVRAAPTRPGRLWVVAAGMHRFDHLPDIQPLPFTTHDARELALALQRQQGRAFSEVKAVVLSEAHPRQGTKAEVLAALRGLDTVQPEDTVVLFLASHGTTDASEYYVVTKDARPEDAARIASAQSTRSSVPAGGANSLLTATEIATALRRLPGRRIVILDTCESGAADGRANPFVLFKRSASAQIAVMSAAQGDQSSFDSLEAPHGVFTLALLTALRGTEAGGASPLTLHAAFDATALQVEQAMERMRARERDPKKREAMQQTPVLSAPSALRTAVLAAP